MDMNEYIQQERYRASQRLWTTQKHCINKSIRHTNGNNVRCKIALFFNITSNSLSILDSNPLIRPSNRFSDSPISLIHPEHL